MRDQTSADMSPTSIFFIWWILLPCREHLEPDDSNLKRHPANGQHQKHWQSLMASNGRILHALLPSAQSIKICVLTGLNPDEASWSVLGFPLRPHLPLQTCHPSSQNASRIKVSDTLSPSSSSRSLIMDTLFMCSGSLALSEKAFDFSFPRRLTCPF